MEDVAVPPPVTAAPAPPIPSFGTPRVRVISRVESPVFDVLAHSEHPYCCLTTDFRQVVEYSDVAVIVVDTEGYFIYANREAERLLAYRVSELTERHITEVVQAEVGWVINEFQYLVDRRIWSGRVLLRPRLGQPVKVSVNAFSSSLGHGGAEHIAFLHPSSDEGPAIVRLAGSGVASQLSVEELALLQLLAAGFSDREIAGILGVDEDFVLSGMDEVRRKLHALSRTEAAIVAMRERLVA